MIGEDTALVTIGFLKLFLLWSWGAALNIDIRLVSRASADGPKSPGRRVRDRGDSLIRARDPALERILRWVAGKEPAGGTVKRVGVFAEEGRGGGVATVSSFCHSCS